MPILTSVGELAASIAPTSFVPKALRGNAAAVTAAILLGREVGLQPLTSLTSIYVVEGTPTLSAAMMRGLVYAAGHHIHVQTWTDTEIELWGYRAGVEEPVGRVMYTIADAQRAGLAHKPTWKQFPRNMLMARCTSELCRAVFPDVIAGLQASEDLDQPGEPSPQRTTVRRRATPEAPAEPVRATQSDEPAPQDSPATLEGSDSPQAPTDEPAITVKQSRMLHARLRDVGLADRDAGLAAIGALIGREVGSTKELTVAEASLVIDRLEAPKPEAE